MGTKPAGRILGAILVGGLARRMGGGDKCLLPVAGRPILTHIVERLAPQCAGLVLNANGDPGRFAGYGLPVVPDDVEGFAGPLAGLLAVLDWTDADCWKLRQHEAIGRSGPASQHDDRGGRPSDLLTVPGDTPFLPPDLVSRLVAAREAEGGVIACAASGGRLHPTVGLWPLAIREELRQALSDGERSIGRFAARYPLTVVAWEGPDPFLNVNTPEDLAAAMARSPSRL